mmetsp:Transcript_47264/g.114885  ORF Transcript_47264/g.114885 Transcript_47264/m.114885 type:complete len:246 (-) Transcript_47264:165-902(-)
MVGGLRKTPVLLSSASTSPRTSRLSCGVMKKSRSLACFAFCSCPRKCTAKSDTATVGLRLHSASASLTMPSSGSAWRREGCSKVVSAHANSLSLRSHNCEKCLAVAISWLTAALTGSNDPSPKKSSTTDALAHSTAMSWSASDVTSRASLASLTCTCRCVYHTVVCCTFILLMRLCATVDACPLSFSLTSALSRVASASSRFRVSTRRACSTRRTATSAPSLPANVMSSSSVSRRASVLGCTNAL